MDIINNTNNTNSTLCHHSMEYMNDNKNDEMEVKTRNDDLKFISTPNDDIGSMDIRNDDPYARNGENDTLQNSNSLDDDKESRSVGHDNKNEKWIKYMQLILTVAGLYYKPVTRHSILSLMFPLLMLLLTFEEFCRNFLLYEHGELFTLRMLKLLVHMQVAQVLMFQILFLFRIVPQMRQFLEKYENFKRYNLKSVTETDDRSLKKRIAVTFIFLTIIPLFLQALSLSDETVIKIWFHHFVFYDHPSVLYFISIMYFLVYTFIRFVYSTTIIFFVIVCTVLGNDFSRMTLELEEVLEDDNLDIGKDERRVQDFRERFLYQCELTNELDIICGPLALSIVLFGVAILVLHVIGFFDMASFHGFSDSLVIIFTCLSALSILMNVGFFMHSCLSLHAKAMTIKPLLLSVNIGEHSQEVFREVTMLLHKIAHDHIGLTAYDLFYLNKPFLVTLGTISMSYAVIIFKFGMMLNSQQSVINALSVNQSSTPIPLNCCFCTSVTPSMSSLTV